MGVTCTDPWGPAGKIQLTDPNFASTYGLSLADNQGNVVFMKWQTTTVVVSL